MTWFLAGWTGADVRRWDLDPRAAHDSGRADGWLRYAFCFAMSSWCRRRVK